jgi:hypothetical protein
MGFEVRIPLDARMYIRYFDVVFCIGGSLTEVLPDNYGISRFRRVVSVI